MELSIAVQLIKEGVATSDVPQTWADIGAGTGLFTRALSGLLSRGSNIIAIDRDRGALESIRFTQKDIHLTKSVLDFVTMPLDLPPMDGVLLANALHFSSNKIALLKSIRPKLKSSGRIVLVEYDTDAANQWVPYPVSLKSLSTVALSAGFASVKKISETPSMYGRAMIYSALLE